ncbi:type 4b pilus protein PilO2 [Marinobacter salarius]|uniref:Pilin accessory protein (PilO) n=1 Tax=Marinobacter salarius TaxID=1420917 RepID=A0A1W6KFV4_9GAMM|nr:type 4b pilus protein PilO2 [Marinobacter salarius]ARM86297.1 pilin accessory protein (PilO) [Marinobacter salarius]
MRRVLVENCPPFAKHVLAGIEWSTTNAKDFKAARAELKTNGKEWLTLSSSNGATKETLNFGAVPKSTLPKQGNGISLGAWLANSMRKGAILALEQVHDQDNDAPVYWICLINDGQVIAGTDILVDDWETAEMMAQGEVEALGDDKIAYVGRNIHELEFIEDSEPYPSLSEILSKSAVVKAKFKNAESSRFTAIVAGVVIGVSLIGGGGYYALDSYLASSELADREERRRENQTQRAKDEYQRLLNKVAGLPNAHKSMNAVGRTVISPTETKIGGWELQKIECIDQSCLINYQNSDLTLPDVLRRGLGNHCDTLEVSADGVDAVCEKAFQAPPLAKGENSPLVQESDIIPLLLSDQEIRRLKAQFMTVAKLTSESAYAINDAIEYPFNGSRWLPEARVFKQGEWVVSFPIRYYSVILGLFGKQQGIALNEVSLNWGNQIVELKGIYVTGEGKGNEG